MARKDLMRGCFAALCLLGALAAAGEEIAVSFARGGWNPKDWIDIKSARWDYIKPFVQMDGHVMNRCPEGIADEELYAKRVCEVYSSMLYAKKFTAKAEITATMSFDHLMAPEIMIVPEIYRDDKGRPVYHEHFEVVLFNEGFNVWRYTWKDGRPSWRKVAFLRTPFKPKTPYTVKVTLERRKDTKELTVSCDGHTFGYADDLLPDTFYTGITGCEGRCRFYDFKVKAAMRGLTDEEAAKADGEH